MSSAAATRGDPDDHLRHRNGYAPERVEIPVRSGRTELPWADVHFSDACEGRMIVTIEADDIEESMSRDSHDFKGFRT